MYFLAWEIVKFSEIHEWIVKWGYGALFGLLFSCGLGVPIPEDVPLITSGVLIYHHQMTWALAAPVAWLGIMAGDSILYCLGYYLGHNVTKVPLIGKHVNVAHIQRAEKMFVTYGVWIVAVGRLFMGVRGAMVVAAGTSRFKYLKFIAVDGLAAIVSGGMFMCLGYWGAPRGRAMWEKIGEFREGTLIVGIIGAIGLFIFIWIRSRRPAKTGGVPETSGSSSK
jgi:membrane protein DedA with SNARE-associated domain